MKRILCSVIFMVGVIAMTAHAEATENLCLNPGFEALNPAGDNFPLNWGAVRTPPTEVEIRIDKDAHSGAIAVRMSATDKGRATLNSDPIHMRAGKISFFYKTVTSAVAGQNLVVYVIAMGEDGIEVPGRTGYSMPAEHVGDGQWHQAEIVFDYTGNAAVAYVLIGARVNENVTPVVGDWLLDDFTCTETRFGPRAVIEALWLSTRILDCQAELVAQIANTGDEPLPASTLQFAVPEGVVVEGNTNCPIQSLLPGTSLRVSLTLKAPQQEAVVDQLRVDWQGEGFNVSRNRRTLVGQVKDPRLVCTDKEGYWRFMPPAPQLQENNSSPLMQLQTKFSVDLPDSYIGVTAHVPRSRDFEVIFEPEHLIDGNPATAWSSRAHPSPVPGPAETVEIQFAKLSEVSEIRLLPWNKGEGFPVDFNVFLIDESGKAVFTHTGIKVRRKADDKENYRIILPKPVKAKGMRLEVTRFSPCAGFFTDCAQTFYCRLNGIEVIDAENNVILTSNGAQVKCSSTFRSFYNSTNTISKTWPEMFRLGVKWNRIGQWGDWTCWAAVERRKGEYQLDPETERAIRESVQNGVNILLTLDYGNPLYEETPWLYDPGPVWRHGHPFTGDGGPTTTESINGFVNYARFMATRLKGVVHYYEIWNEQNSWAWYGSPPDPKAFGTLVRETAKALKEIDPQNKVMIGGTAALAPVFIGQALEEGAGSYLDAVAFHPYTMPYPEMGLGSLDVIDGKQVSRGKDELGYTTYEEMLAFLRGHFEKYNPKFEFWANEWNAIPKRDGMVYPSSSSEIGEAKQIARFFTMASCTGVRGVWWSLCNNNGLYDWAVLRFRDYDNGEPVTDWDRKPSYRAVQSVATILSGVQHDSSIQVAVIGNAPALRCEPFRRTDGSVVVALWSAVDPVDDELTGERISLCVSGINVKSILAVNTIHALTQQVVYKEEGKDIVISDLLVPDYPVLVVLEPKD